MKQRVIIFLTALWAFFIFAAPGLAAVPFSKNTKTPSSPSNPKPAITFTDINAGLITIQGDAAWGDYDNDGYLDLIIIGLDYPNNGPYPVSPGITKIYHNNGNGTFTDINANIGGVGFGSVAWGDYDNDGDLDIALTGAKKISTTNYFPVSRIYRNDGNGLFIDIMAGLTNVRDSHVAWGDYDNDGRLDLLLTGRPGATGWYICKIYHNDGNNTFTDINAGLVGSSNPSAAWGDYDNDGDLDILTGFIAIGDIPRIYRNDGNGLFTNIAAGLTTSYSGHVAWGDYNNDSYLDIVICTSAGPKVYRNNGNGTFTDILASLGTVCTHARAAWGDYDNDGRLDLVIMGREPDTFTYKTTIYHNDGNNIFSPINANLTGVYKGNVAWGDYDNDGRLDLVVIGEGEPYAMIFSANIYHNQGGPANSVPNIVSGLTSSVSGNNVTLSWQPTTDAQTPSGGLSYNIRIGTATHAINALSPMAEIKNGWRRIPAKGWTIQGTGKTIRNLPPGIYYWSVQAIDTALAGSPLLTQLHSFMIGPLLVPPPDE